MPLTEARKTAHEKEGTFKGPEKVTKMRMGVCLSVRGIGLFPFPHGLECHKASVICLETEIV